MRRPTSVDRKIGSLEKKRTPKIGLKRTISLIPRATSLQRPKTPTPVGGKKRGRKSETALKNKELFNDVATEDKKPEPIGHTKTDSAPESGQKPAEENEAKKQQAGRRVISAKEQTVGTLAKRPNSCSSCGMSDNTTREKSEIRGAHKNNSNHEEKREGSLEALYKEKKNEYKIMLKQFERRKKAIKDSYALLEELRKRIILNCGKEMEPLETIIIGESEPPFQVPDIPVVSETKTNDIERRSVITFESTILKDMNIDFSELNESIEANLNQCREVWIQLIPLILKSKKDLINKIMTLNPAIDDSEFSEDASLELAIENAKNCFRIKLNELSMYLNELYTNREKLKYELETLMDSKKLSDLIGRDYKEMLSTLKQLEEELTKEKIRTEDLMEKRNLVESKCQSHEMKVNELQKTNSELRDELSQLNSQIKLLRQKELTARRTIGPKMKELKDLKEKSDLLKAMENHITELTNDHNIQTKAFQKKIEELEQQILEMEEALKTQTQITESLKESLAEAEEKIQHVREKKKVFADMVDQTKQILQGTSPTKREEQLWIELEATKIIVKG